MWLIVPFVSISLRTETWTHASEISCLALESLGGVILSRYFAICIHYRKAILRKESKKETSIEMFVLSRNAFFSNRQKVSNETWNKIPISAWRWFFLDSGFFWESERRYGTPVLVFRLKLFLREGKNISWEKTATLRFLVGFLPPPICINRESKKNGYTSSSSWCLA